jgi:hypothetical protein
MERPAAPAGPILVTGMARAGTSWVGKVVESTRRVTYVNEPMNPKHPPGRSPGVLAVSIPYEYLYISGRLQPQADYIRAFTDMLALRYGVAAELRVNRSTYDVLRMLRYVATFTAGRALRTRPMVNDPYACLSVPWLAEHFDVRTVIVVRHPVRLLASHRRARIPMHVGELLQQEALMEDWLEPLADDLKAARDSADDIEVFCALWRALHTVMAGALDRPDVTLLRYEDACVRPAEEFRRIIEAVGLPYTDDTDRFIETSVSGGGTRARSHVWDLSLQNLSLRSLPSRTAYRPLDSAAHLESWREVVDDRDVERVQASTWDVGRHFFDEATWSLASR